MRIRELKKIIEKLPDNMVVTTFDQNGTIVNAIAYVDGPGDEDESGLEWLVIDTKKD